METVELLTEDAGTIASAIRGLQMDIFERPGVCSKVVATRLEVATTRKPNRPLLVVEERLVVVRRLLRRLADRLDRTSASIAASLRQLTWPTLTSAIVARPRHVRPSNRAVLLGTATAIMAAWPYRPPLVVGPYPCAATPTGRRLHACRLPYPSLFETIVLYHRSTVRRRSQNVARTSLLSDLGQGQLRSISCAATPVVTVQTAVLNDTT